ncbi:PREDICTED: probable disease resistance protein At5g63020 [Theobroma cacao]|uniref:Probable disease resistance protein At5g63020 n=1 Tax=Theobroma cacao TaxID=3641 RepID=A0AB32X0B2_THECC|nr:PREDICTED: probable disease resistance protein At5g63020 [Theobroma cacao]
MGNLLSIPLSCDTIFSRCWDCAAGQAIYTCKLEENLADLNTALDELKERRNDVMRKVNIAEQGNMKQLDQVQGWLSRTEAMINDVDQLITDGPQEIKKLCMGGCFSKNYMSSLRFSKTVSRKLHDVKDLNLKGAFEEVATTAPAALVVERPSDFAIGLESMLNTVWSSFEEKHVGIIGIYGLGGVGKTRLLTEINNRIALSSGGFEVVIWVVVSKGFYVEKVLDDIAKRIGVSSGTWNDKTTEEKATEIFGVLRKKRKRVDLSKVGIPSPTQENGFKLIFTTRSIEVCGQMRADKKIEVTCLPEEKAWQLFEEHVGKDPFDSLPNIRDLAQEVAKECGGLPLALITIGRAMAYKTTYEEWKYAIEVLRRSSATSIFQGMGEKVYPLLKYSFDSLSSDMVRSCLLYCSLFSEDFFILKEWLIDCWIGEGFLDEHDNISQARNQGHHIIGSLIQACLLEEVDDWYVKMHDVIRDMCLWIACTCEAEKWKFFVQAGYQLTKVPEVGKWTGVRRMSLMDNKIENLKEAPNCPDLQSLFLSGNKPLDMIDDDFFQFMCVLKVLDLSRNKGIAEFPMGISKLVSLEYLDLSFTNIRELPIELRALKKLKCFKLQYIDNRIKIPRGLMPGFSKLEILRMIGSFPFYKDEAMEDDNECLVEELQCLNHLNVLTLTVTSAFAVDRFLSTEKLYNFIEWIGLQYLKDSKQLNVLSLASFKSLNTLSLVECESLEEVKTVWEGEGRIIKGAIEIQTSVIASVPCFQSLLDVRIDGCSKLRDITWLILAPNLKRLLVLNCDKMEEIINEIKLRQVVELVKTLNRFSNLQYLVLLNLPELKSIYLDALPYSCMKVIRVRKCPKLRRLPLNSNSAKGNKISIYGEEKWWKELQWEDESTQNAFLPSFIPW